MLFDNGLMETLDPMWWGRFFDIAAHIKRQLLHLHTRIPAGASPDGVGVHPGGEAGNDREVPGILGE